MPRNPRLIFQICQKRSLGFLEGALGEVTVGPEAMAIVFRVKITRFKYPSKKHPTGCFYKFKIR
jgi:hypothetical protein